MMELSCDYNHSIQFRIVDGELNLTNVTPDEDTKTVPITTKSQLDDLIALLQGYREYIARD